MVRVITQNMDEGTDFLEIMKAKTVSDFLQAVATTYTNIIATNPAERATAMAREIAKNRADLVGLQEASVLRTGPLGESPLTAADVKMDLLASLLSQLANLGEHYSVVAIVPGLDAEAPAPSLGFNVRITTQDAIIARDDVEMLSQPEVHQYQSLLTISLPTGQSLPIPRGWASIDAMVRGHKLRFVTTHLEPNDPSVQLAEAQELAQKAGDTNLPVVFAGDFNADASNPSGPTFATYQALIDAGFQDAWGLRRQDPGYTCCEDPLLLNPKPTLDQRTDLILLRTGFSVGDVNRIGDKQSNRTPSGLWPSDHAGVEASLIMADQ
jgi:endonuclease/exonuclease/phosphatase family metal-dependent hydrolase